MTVRADEVRSHANLIWSIAELLRGDYKPRREVSAEQLAELTRLHGAFRGGRAGQDRAQRVAGLPDHHRRAAAAGSLGGASRGLGGRRGSFRGGQAGRRVAQSTPGRPARHALRDPPDRGRGARRCAPRSPMRSPNPRHRCSAPCSTRSSSAAVQPDQPLPPLGLGLLREADQVGGRSASSASNPRGSPVSHGRSRSAEAMPSTISDPRCSRYPAGARRRGPRRSGALVPTGSRSAPTL